MSSENIDDTNISTEAEVLSPELTGAPAQADRDRIADIVRDVVAQILPAVLNSSLEESEYDLPDLDIVSLDWSSDGTVSVLPLLLHSMSVSNSQNDANANPAAGTDEPGAPTSTASRQSTMQSASDSRGTAPADTLTCAKCSHSLKLPPPDDRWYSIWKGRRVGWCKGWNLMDQLTRGVRGQGMSYRLSESDARALFSKKLKSGEVEVVEDHKAVAYDPVSDGELFP